jgi:hypothetical protein
MCRGRTRKSAKAIEPELAENPDGLNRSVQHHLIGMIYLKVVFMAQGKRDRLSTEQRIDMGRRWKAGESLHDIWACLR